MVGLGLCEIDWWLQIFRLSYHFLKQITQVLSQDLTNIKKIIITTKTSIWAHWSEIAGRRLLVGRAAKAKENTYARSVR